MSVPSPNTQKLQTFANRRGLEVRQRDYCPWSFPCSRQPTSHFQCTWTQMGWTCEPCRSLPYVRFTFAITGSSTDKNTCSLYSCWNLQHRQMSSNSIQKLERSTADQHYLAWFSLNWHRNHPFPSLQSRDSLASSILFSAQQSEWFDWKSCQFYWTHFI